MARTLEFDYDTTLERATRLFWKSGYAGTSLRDLLKEMGIGESSFYNTMKSKKRAYLECLKHYNETVARKRAKVFLEAPTAALGVRALFNNMLESLDNPDTPAVICMMAGSLTHEVLDEAELREYIEGRMTTLRDTMIARMNADKRDGLLTAGFEPQFVVPIVSTYMQGLWRMALVSYERSSFERQIDVFLTGLGL
ncbi:TetR/AcrR family transcriptional regulator [Terracidiphilus gabretensis]|uniref:TetR/AcrR family transcriptional regulator n=1 Tax=Terracidiphilus gabretensis TaxID=1577687 RepID=UPI00071BFF14|nr:TetR/AcrR family transcriptional regulator [Terracidiphilus gabretensis]